MTDKKPSKTAPSFETIPAGTSVISHYRSAIGHGTVTGVHKPSTTAANTMYSVIQHDHHPDEPAVVHHSGKALIRTGSRTTARMVVHLRHEAPNQLGQLR